VLELLVLPSVKSSRKICETEVKKVFVIKRKFYEVISLKLATFGWYK